MPAKLRASPFPILLTAWLEPMRGLFATLFATLFMTLFTKCPLLAN